MAIVIPSKYIYSKSFDPVIDNNISRIEVSSKKSQFIYDYETPVATKKIPYGMGIVSNIDSIPQTKFIRSRYEGENAVSLASTGIQILDTYYTFNIKLPKQGNSRLITKIYTGIRDFNGKPAIELTKTHQEKVYYDEIPNIYSVISLSDITYQFDFAACRNHIYKNLIMENDIEGFHKRKVTLTAVRSRGEYGFFTEWSKPKIEMSDSYFASLILNSLYNNIDHHYDNESHMAAIDYKEENGEYVFNDIKILFKREIFFVASAVSAPSIESQLTDTYPAKVIKCEQVVKSVDLRFYGDTISLDLQDIAFKMGDGNKVFSFDGNELIQTTNTPTIEIKYQEIIDKWKNGKQTATISCPITDYYDIDGNKVIDTSVSGKMLIREGDIVVPYVYTNHGDKTLSYNRNFTPKQFKVVGTKISKRQGGMQELTLQET